MYINKYTHNLESTMVTEHIANKLVTLVTLVTLLYIQYHHTLHCTLRHEVLLMQDISRRFIDKCNALRNEMHVEEIFQSHHQGKL